MLVITVAAVCVCGGGGGGGGPQVPPGDSINADLCQPILYGIRLPIRTRAGQGRARQGGRPVPCFSIAFHPPGCCQQSSAAAAAAAESLEEAPQDTSDSPAQSKRGFQALQRMGEGCREWEALLLYSPALKDGASLRESSHGHPHSFSGSCCCWCCSARRRSFCL